MSDLSDFSEGDFEQESPQPKKGSLARAITAKLPGKGQKEKDATKNITDKKETTDSKKENKDKHEDKEDSKENKNDNKESKASTEKTENNDEKKTLTQPSSKAGKRMSSGLQPALDRATGVLSPPDFFISKIVHDSQCFTAKVGHSVVEAKGFIYIFGGEDAEKNSTSALIKFNPGNNSFEVVDDIGENPGARRCATVNLWKPHTRAEPGLLLFGGLDELQNVSSEVWAFDLKSFSWKELRFPKGPEARHSHAAVFCEKTNELFIFGGQGNDGQVINSAYVLKGTSWLPLSSASEESAPKGRCGHSASLCVSEGKPAVAIFGGDLSGAGKGANDLWMYNIEDDSWHEVKEFAGEPPCPRWKHAAAYFDNRLWIIGGTYGGWFKNYIMSDFFVFDFFAKTWFKCGVDPQELGCHTDIGSLTVLPANRAIYIFGGADVNGNPTSDVYRLAPVCTTVSISNLRQDIVRTVTEVKQVRTDMDTALRETQNLKDSISKLEGTSVATDKRMGELATIAQSAEEKVKDLVQTTGLLAENLKKMEQAVAEVETKMKSFASIERKFGIMEVTIQETLAKLEKQADLYAVKALAAKAESGSDEDEE